MLSTPSPSPAPARSPRSRSRCARSRRSALASFASQALVRAADTLLPQIAADFADLGRRGLHRHHRLCADPRLDAVHHRADRRPVRQIPHGGDRLRAVRRSRWRCAGSRSSLDSLTLARFASGITVAWILPISLAYIGDVVPYEQRQQLLGRFLAAQMLGQLFGQAAGGIVGDYFGWRTMFFLLAAMLALAAVALGLRARDQSDHARRIGTRRRGSARWRATRSCCATRGRASCCSRSASRARCSKACSPTSAPTCICASG